MSRGGDWGIDSTQTLDAQMASATGTTQPIAHVWYYDVDTQAPFQGLEPRIEYIRTALNDTTVVTICAGPDTTKPWVRRIFSKVAILNRSTASEIITVILTAGILDQTLLTRQALIYNRSDGWQVVGP